MSGQLAFSSLILHTKLMDLPQTVSLIAVSVLSTLAIVIGIQVILLLKELKMSLSRLNSVLDTAENTLNKIAHPVAGVAGIVEGLKQSTKIIDTIAGFVNKHRTPEPPIQLDDNHDQL